MRIIVFGNCQSVGLVNCLTLMAEDHEVVRRADTDLTDLRADDIVLLQTPLKSKLAHISERVSKLILWPHILFDGYHPDIVYLTGIDSPIGAYHSSICLAAWKQGLSLEETRSLFCKEVFESLDFFGYYDRARSWLESQIDNAGFPGRQLLERWCAQGCFMHGINHPKLHVTADIARVLMEKLELATKIRRPEMFLADGLLNDLTWPVYPPLGKAIGLPPDEYLFKAAARLSPGRLAPVYDLETFISKSYEIYQKTPELALICDRIERPAYKNLRRLVHTSRTPAQTSTVSPYKGLADYQFWRRAIEQTPGKMVDPVVSGKFEITKTQKIATAGSCFAQHISRTLLGLGFNYYLAEQASPGMSPEEALSRHFGIFSARYGNIYTARQLFQLFERAYGRFQPTDSAWMNQDGRWADPFRPTVEPDGFSSEEDVEKATKEHLARVRSMFESLDVFVFTLGLSEAWRSKKDGAVFPLAPGVAAGSMDFDEYEFINFNIENTVDDLRSFINGLAIVNPAAKVILTVSPVPLIATYEKRHVLYSTTYSKSVLRVAAETIASENDHVAYFPAYEVITGAFNRGAYFENDLRSVRSEGVEHVMSLFLKHYTRNSATATSSGASAEPPVSEVEKLLEVVCDESCLDPVLPSDLQ